MCRHQDSRVERHGARTEHRAIASPPNRRPVRPKGHGLRGADSERTRHEDSRHERPRHERTGHERPGHEKSGSHVSATRGFDGFATPPGCPTAKGRFLSETDITHDGRVPMGCGRHCVEGRLIDCVPFVY